MNISKVGFGGGCHWCTEAVFQSLLGVEKVEQGWIASEDENESFSEAVIVYFNPKEVPLKILMEVHLRTHKSSSKHSMRSKYRSAIYYFQNTEKYVITNTLESLKKEIDQDIITQVLPFKQFKESREEIQNYYFKNPDKPFCQTYITPKLKLILEDNSAFKNSKKL